MPRFRKALPTFDSETFSRERLNLIVRLIESRLGEVEEITDLSGYALADHDHTLSDITDYVPPTLDSLTDVDVEGADPGDVLAWDGSEWVAVSPGSTTAFPLDDLTDVQASAPGDFDLLVYSAELGMWGNLSLVSLLAELDDVGLLPYLPLAGGTMTGDIVFETGIASDYDGVMQISSDGTDGFIASSGDLFVSAAGIAVEATTDITLAFGGDFFLEQAALTILNTTLTDIEITDRNIYLTNAIGYGTLALDGADGGSVDLYGAGVYMGSLYADPLVSQMILSAAAGNDALIVADTGYNVTLVVGNPTPIASISLTGAGELDMVLTDGTIQTGTGELVIDDMNIRVINDTARGSINLDGPLGGSVRFYDDGVFIGTVYSYLATGMRLETPGSFELRPGSVTALEVSADYVRVVRTLNLQPVAGDIASPVSGDLWYNPTTGKFRGRQGSTTYDVIGAGGTLDGLSDVVITAVADDQILVYDSGTSMWVNETPVKPLDVAVFVQGKPTNAELVARLEVPRAFTIPASATGSQASARVASTGNVSFDVLKNGVSFATVVFNVSATGSFTMASLATFAAGDLLTITAPATADATLEDISITFVGSRT